ncbi:hypothetical protein BGZ76_003546 [Entomortierella beljakovae]|nr:hypothetical protein BGZ76_003546 [Entomortierella beljakovae]
MPHALEISEIQIYLSQFLTLEQLFECSLVCKNWRATFSPMLYVDMSLSYHINLIPSLQTLEKYSPYVKFLCMDGVMVLNYYSIHYVQLIELSVVSAFPEYRPTAEALSQLIHGSKHTLKRVNIDIIELPESTPAWNALAQCNDIYSLRFHNFTITSEAIKSIFTTLTNITKLDLAFVSMEDATLSLLVPESFTPVLNLTHITYNGTPAERQAEQFVLRLINISPNLLTLSWIRVSRVPTSLMHDINLLHYKNTMNSQLYKNFKHVSLSGMFDDKYTAYALNAMTNATELKLSIASFGRLSYQSLMRRHASTIVQLDIRRCPHTTGDMAQGILSGCPSLEKLAAPYIRGEDLVRVQNPGAGESEISVLGQDWVCLRLKSLSLFFAISTFDPYAVQSISEELHRRRELEQLHAFLQLSRLHDLEFLNIDGKKEVRGYTHLELNLQSNGGELERLKTLKKLKGFGAQGPIDDESLDWMKKNWPHCIL